jgi:CrcB protein
MPHTILVGLGGALGAVARWKLSALILHHTPDWRFPLGTFAVNVAGCVIAGLLAGAVTKLDWFSPDTRLFLFTGLLGGFTTFSAFGVETVYLLRRAQYGIALAYILLSLVAGLAGLWLAMKIVPGRSA